MVEVHASMGSQMAANVSSHSRSLIRPNLPVFVLECAFTLIRNAHHASEACSLLNESLDLLSVEDLIKLHTSLNDLVMNKLQATFLSGALSSTAIQIADRLVRNIEIEDEGSAEISNAAQLEAFKVLQSQIQFFIPYPFGHIRGHVKRLLNWAERYLLSDHCDKLRMQVLGCMPDGDEVNLPWSQTRWSPSTHRSFPVASEAVDLIKKLSENRREGAGIQFALQSAMYIATNSRSERESISLIREAERLYSSKKIGIQFFKSTAFLKQLIFTGQKEKAMQLFHIIRVSNEEEGKSTSINVWAHMIGMLANLGESPDLAMRMLDLNNEDESQSKDQSISEHVPFDLAPKEVRDKPYIYAKLIQQISLRPDNNYIDRIPNIWKLMLEKGVKPDLYCLEEYCLALVRLGHTTAAMSTLEGWLTVFNQKSDSNGLNPPKPTSGMLYRMMKRMIEQEETQEVYSLYLKKMYKWPGESDSILLPTLLRAAEEAYVKQEEQGYSDNHPMIARMLFQRKEPQKHKNILWDEIPAPLRARQIFRQTLFDNYPDLYDLPHPLNYDQSGKSLKGGLWRNEIRMQKFEEWLSHKLNFDGGNGQQDRFDSLLLPNNDRLRDVQIKTDHLESSCEKDKIQKVTLQCTHDLFENYLRLLPHVEDCAREIGMGLREKDQLQIGWDERLLVLSWMRFLDISPNKSCLCLICAYIQERMPPMFEGSLFFQRFHKSANQDPYSYANHSAAGPLHKFLADWIGENNIPTHEDVAASIRRNLRD